jgi:hypothetical protein
MVLGYSPLSSFGFCRKLGLVISHYEMPWTNVSLMIGLESMETSVMFRDDWLYGQDVTDIGLLALADRALTLRTLKLKLAVSSSAERCSEVAVMECELCPRLLLLFRLLVGCYAYLFLMCHELPEPGGMLFTWMWPCVLDSGKCLQASYTCGAEQL